MKQEGTFFYTKDMNEYSSKNQIGEKPAAPESPEDCRAVGTVLALVGNKWSVMLIVKLGERPMRFNEIKRAIGGISQRMLTLTLRDLEREGLVTRTVYPTTALTVDYKLTKLGHSLWQVVHPLGVWARIYMTEMAEARQTFDLAKQKEPGMA